MSPNPDKFAPGRRAQMAAFIFNLNKYFRLNTIVYSPILLSVIVLVIGFLLGERIYPDAEIPPQFIGSVFLLMSLIASTTGFIQIIIQEVPGLIFPVQGKAATIIGIIWVVFFGLTSIGIVRYYFILR